MNNDIIERITQLYADGKKYREIATEVDCSIDRIKAALRGLRAAGIIKRRNILWIDKPKGAAPSRARRHDKKRLSRQQARVLKALHERRGDLVPQSALVAALAMKRPSARSKVQVHVVISKIRAKLPGIKIIAVPREGYVLHA